MTDEDVKIESLVSCASSIFCKEAGFMSYSMLKEKLVELGGDTAYFDTAMDRMTSRQQIEYDPQYGYCRPGTIKESKNQADKKSVSRAVFDAMSPRRQMEWINDGGIVI
jgi:hypothetical protein